MIGYKHKKTKWVAPKRKAREMTIGFLVRMLTAETEVIIKDQNTGKTLFEGCASAANFNDEVKDWDFSKDHIIYI